MNTDPARWARIQTIFHQIADAPKGERAALLQAACAGDDDLQAAVLRLLHADASPTSLMDADVHLVARSLFGQTASGDTLDLDFGSYRLVRTLGEGGMGVVFLAHRTDIGQSAAIKVLREIWVSPAGRERFTSEQRTLARLIHQSIARLYHADTLADGTPWFAMEYVEGVALTDYCTRHVPGVDDRLRLFRDVCEAVQHAHQHLIVHRDLKPSNILVTSSGSVKLLDFGIAKQLDEAGVSADRTQSALRFLTPNYAAPEQLRGAPVGIPSDVYSLGVILYELLTNRRPFNLTDVSPREAEAIVLEQDPPGPSVVARSAARARALSRSQWADLDAICLTAMHKDPLRRYRSVDALVRDIDHYRGGRPLDARPDQLGYRTGKFLRRHRQPAAAATLAVTLLAGTVAFYTVQVRDQRTQAQIEAAKAQQVSEYLIGLFEAADPFAPDRAAPDLPGLLARGVERAERLSAQPGVQAQMLDVLGRIHTHLSEYDRAGDLLQRALALRRSAGSRVDEAATLANLGKLHSLTGQRDGAEAYLREALALRQQHLPPAHPDIGVTLNDLGSLLTEKGEYQEADALYRLALEILRDASREPQEALAHTLTNLGVNYFNQGNFAAAEPFYREALAADRALYGPEHPNTAVKQANLALVLESQRDLAQADALLSEALGIFGRTLGDEHYLSAFYRTTLGSMLRRRDEYDRAEVVLREAVAINERLLGSDHPNTTVAIQQLALTVAGQGRYEEAEPLFGRAVNSFLASLGDQHYYSGASLCQYANVLRINGKTGEAEAPLREGLAILERVLPAEHPDLPMNTSRLGALLTARSRFAEAEPLLLDSYEALIARQGSAHTYTREAAGHLVALYEAWNRPEDADAYRTVLSAGEDS